MNCEEIMSMKRKKEINTENYDKKVQIITQWDMFDVPHDNSFFTYFNYIDNTGNTFLYKKHPRIDSMHLNGVRGVFNGHKYAVFHIETINRCDECGSLVNVEDEIRGEAVCPTCGLVQYQIAY
jgi:hypothetical protein